MHVPDSRVMREGSLFFSVGDTCDWGNKIRVLPTEAEPWLTYDLPVTSPVTHRLRYKRHLRFT